jgi:hypothetical protein
MKKIKTMFFALITVLFLLFGCSGNDGSGGGGGGGDNDVKAQGNVIILQAYGNAGDSSPNGVSHSFVELYNISDVAINLEGISLYYANGIRSTAETPVVTEDEPWQSIALSGTIPAKGSFLVLGAKHSNLLSTRYKIDDGYGDINDSNLSLSRRGFKVAVIKGTALLTVQNPFDTDGSGNVISGYIDMVGALNDSTNALPDHIFGFEAAPTRNSASEAVRRKDLLDMDNNLNDFEAARYALTGDGAFTNEMLEVRKPRNSSAGAWNPFKEPAEPPEPPDTTDVDYTKLRLNEVSGVGNDSDKFYELINLGDKDIPLYDCKIYYNANSNTGGTLPSGKGNVTWTGLTSQTIEAGKLFSLIGRDNPTGTNPGSFTTGLTAGRILIITLEDPKGNVIDKCVRTSDTGDYAFTDKSFSRIPDGTGDFYFTTSSPNAKNAASADGLIKLPVDPPFITAFGRSPSSVTQEDTVTVSATVTPTTSSAITTVVLKWTLNGNTQSDISTSKSGNVYSAVIPVQALSSVVNYKILATNDLGETNSTDTQLYTVTSTAVDNSAKLMILQANTYGNENQGFKYSLVELYNNTNDAITLTGNYYLHIGNATAWTYQIPLTGTVPSKCSFLIVSTSDVNSNNPRAALPTEDQSYAFVIINNNFKIALMRNQSAALSVNNPFGDAGLSADYVDMLGCGTTNGYETTAANAPSRPQGRRRTSLTDTDVNKDDFGNVDYRVYSGSNGMPDSDLYKYWPRNTAAGAWNPITGLPKIDPVVP